MTDAKKRSREESDSQEKSSRDRSSSRHKDEKRDKSESSKKKDEEPPKKVSKDSREDTDSRKRKSDDKAPAAAYQVPIASPLAEGETLKKTLRLVQKASQESMIYKGIRDVTKQVRKGAVGVCVLAADVSPMDVISHLPIHCEKNKVSYIWVPSKDDLGASASAARATSAVLVRRGGSDDLKTTVEKAAKTYAELRGKSKSK